MTMNIDQTRSLLALLETAEDQNISPEMAITLLQANINADHDELAPVPQTTSAYYVYELWGENQLKISAIKTVRKYSADGLGLKEAKEAVEQSDQFRMQDKLRGVVGGALEDAGYGLAYYPV